MLTTPIVECNASLDCIVIAPSKKSFPWFIKKSSFFKRKKFEGKFDFIDPDFSKFAQRNVRNSSQEEISLYQFGKNNQLNEIINYAITKRIYLECNVATIESFFSDLRVIQFLTLKTIELGGKMNLRFFIKGINEVTQEPSVHCVNIQLIKDHCFITKCTSLSEIPLEEVYYILKAKRG